MVFNFSLLLLFRFDTAVSELQFTDHYEWLLGLNINISFGLDGIALFMVLLTTFLTPVCVLLG